MGTALASPRARPPARRADERHRPEDTTLYRVVAEELETFLIQVVLQLKSPYRDGTTHIVMRPQQFMQRLAALIPRARLHLIRFHGVLAPHAKLRAALVPDVVQPASEPAHGHTHGQASRIAPRAP
ncbi:MAG: transposase [Burkholderiales bacterium]|nr:transposase [Burkholderiales bacterium]